MRRELRLAPKLHSVRHGDAPALSEIDRIGETEQDTKGGRPGLRALRVRAALESAGVIFVEENGDGPGVRLRKGVNEKAAGG
jgi:hypothetical protein